jgi:uncharacterized membrane protein YedE/YeeE
MMDVGSWLRGLGLERYEAAFRENEIDETVLPTLTADDLKDLGVGFVGHRRKLLNAIAALRADAIDTPLISGAVIFGVGWGLAGYCPGPALVSLASGRMEVFVFVTAMVTGMIAVRGMRGSPAALPTGLGQS